MAVTHVLVYRVGSLVTVDILPGSARLDPSPFDEDVFTTRSIGRIDPERQSIPTFSGSAPHSSLVPERQSIPTFSGSAPHSAHTPSVQTDVDSPGGVEDPNAWWPVYLSETQCVGDTITLIQYPTYATPHQYDNVVHALGVGDPCTP